LKDQAYPIVIKASGLAEGKGVVIVENYQQAQAVIDDIMVKKQFGDSGNTVVIEQFLTGREVSIHALCDGHSAILFPASQDHKQVLDGDKGPNTGGMGVVAPLPWVTEQHMQIVREKIVQPALAGLKSAGSPFTGCLYPGLMVDGNNVNVIEFNSRFGDPEAETYMRLLDSDLYEILLACTKGKLDPSKVAWKPGVAISVAVASAGYPGRYEKGKVITGVEEAEKQEGVVVFQAGTAKTDKGLETSGGRVLYVTALGHDLDDARAKAYKAIACIKFEGMHYRTDIGTREA
jgi:phosphoribosylamine--glycine ligase